MAEEYSLDDPSQLLQASAEFANYPGVQTDASVHEFLHRFPLPAILNALQTKSGDVAGLESTLVDVLESVFKTRYGASLIPQYMSFIQVGLMADSQKVKALACKTVTRLLESVNDYAVSAHLIIDNNLYPLLIDCLINGNEQVTTVASEAIVKIAASPAGIDIVFPADTNDSMHLGKLASKCSSLGRVRILALIVKLFSVSHQVASVVSKSNLLRLFEENIGSNDILATLNVMELLYELSEIKHGRVFLSSSTFLQLLTSIISNQSMESILKSRAIIISGRLLSNGNYILADESSAKTVVSAIDKILDSSKSHDTDECETALEALGQIGSSMEGAQLLLSSSPPAARHVICFAFDRQGHGRQLAALHALANIAGETRSDNSVILSGDAEERLRRLIYESASRSSKLTPSGLFLSVLQQDEEKRLAGYRLLTGLGARPWCLMEICSKQEIINIVTDANSETKKLGMEARFNCCKTFHTAFNMTSKLSSDPALGGIAAKLHEAVRQGPHLARKHHEAQPTVVTADRF